MRSRILTSYIFKEIAQYFLGALFSFTAMLLAVNMLKFASLIINKGVASDQIGMVFLSLIPTFLEIAVPMSALLGVMLGFARLSGDSEIIVFRASGISIFHLAFPVVIFGMLAMGGSLYISLVARPWGYDNLSKTLFSIASSSSIAGLDEGVFSKLGMMTMYAAEVDHQTGDMKKVLLDDRRDKDNRKIVFSKTGYLRSNPTTRQIVISLQDGEIHEMTQGKYSVTHFQTNTSVLESQDLFSDDAAKKGKQLNSMNLVELSTMETAYRELKKRIVAGETFTSEQELPLGLKISPDQITHKEVSKRVNRSRIEYGRRFSMPYAVFILSLVGMTLGIQPPRTQRTWGIGISAVFGIGVFVIYYGFLSVGIALSEGSKMDPLVALWLPNVVVTSLALWTFWQVGTERWASATEGLDDLTQRIKAKFSR